MKYSLMSVILYRSSDTIRVKRENHFRLVTRNSKRNVHASLKWTTLSVRNASHSSRRSLLSRHPPPETRESSKKMEEVSMARGGEGIA